MEKQERILRIDLHLHPGWTDFAKADQEKRTKEEREDRIRLFLCRYREQGIVLARDAGGFAGIAEAAGTNAPAGIFSESALTRVLPNGGMLSGSDTDGKAAEAAVKTPYSWIKIFATGGIGADADHATDPSVSREYFFRTVRKIHEAGKKVMVHTWGGETLDWCIEAGADSVEHGIYMTPEQAGRMAEKGIPLIPTCGVYRLLAEKPKIFGIGALLQERAKRAADAQLRSVPAAIRAGILIGYGTDFYADPALASYSDQELITLEDLGLTHEEAVRTGTVNAAKILGMRWEDIMDDGGRKQ